MTEPWIPPMMRDNERAIINNKRQESHQEIRQRVIEKNAEIKPRTQAHNRKCSEKTVEDERELRGDVLSAQIKAWRALLPKLLKQFSRIPDPRRTKSVEHKLVTLMVFGLFAFIFRLQSRREMNRELTGAVIHSNLHKLFPDLETIPHADTLARLLKRINPLEIEKAHIGLIRDLIDNKKFKKLLIQNCLPITIDGAQKLCRDGLLHDGRWCERKVGKDGAQQYVYTIEANITLKNGLTIPLLTEYLYRENEQVTNPSGKQDCEITAFARMARRLKKYFPRLQIILFMDSLYATQGIMKTCSDNNWEFMITLPTTKLKHLTKLLNQKKGMRQSLPEQLYYRERQQEFYWNNHVCYGDDADLNIHLVGCLEKYDKVNKQTGEIETCYSTHNWISSIPFSILNLHELCNSGARKKELIEDSFNTEKNRGYHYKHAFSYNWHAMQGFHYLIRLGHAIGSVKT